MTGLVLILLALALVIAWAVAAPLAFGWDWTLRRLPAHRALRVARWSLVPLAGALGAGALVAVAASGLLDHGLHCHCLATGGFHLCLVHPAQSAPAVPFAALMFGALAWRIVPQLRRWWRARRSSLALVEMARDATVDGAVRVVEMDAYNAFTVGRKPVVLASRAWWHALAPTERAVVAAHEQAHVDRGDPATLSVARFLAAWLPAKADRFVWWWHASAEHEADRHAARVAGPVQVAEFLLRQACAHPPGMAAHGTATEHRIEALLDCTPASGPAEGDLDTTLAAVVGLGIVGVTFGAELHAWAEALLAWLS